MKRILNVFFLSICILCLASAVSQAKENPVVQADYQIQPSSVFDITYVVFIWTPVSSLFNPRYIDQFEFKAGDVFSAYTTKHGELTGKWIESVLGNKTWFQAWVEKEETSTTTTTPTGTTTTIPSVQSTETSRFIEAKDSKLKYDINIWGVSFTPPEPFQNFSTIFGYGAYLGVDAFFFGFAGLPTEPAFGSINPQEGEQDQSFEVTITGLNTTFESAGTLEVDMGQGITVGTPAPQTNTELRVTITIAADAEVGPRTVVVTYDNNVISKANAFTVKKKTT